MIQKPRTIFFGTSHFAVIVLETLKDKGITPDVLVTTPDRPQGRKLLMTPPPAKVWAEKAGIQVLQFEKLNDDAVLTLKELTPQLFIVASYGKIIPQKVLDIPTQGTLNIHPSLLPLYRGASPLQSTILADDKNTGVTIMQMDAQMDHGPIVAVRKITIGGWPPRFSSLEDLTAKVGAELLAETLESYISGALTPIPQDDSKATYTKKITKEDGLIEVRDDMSSEEQYKNFLKLRAFEGWPGVYYFTQKKQDPTQKIRVSIKDGEFIDGKFVITKVTPEGHKEMSYEDFLKGF